MEVVQGITSLGRDQADAARLLELVRGHRGIEDGLHFVRDVTLGEDACRVRTGAAPPVLAAIRNTVVHLLAGVKAASKAAATRRVPLRSSPSCSPNLDYRTALPDAKSRCVPEFDRIHYGWVPFASMFGGFCPWDVHRIG